MPPCLTTSLKHSQVFNIQLHASLSINRTPMSNQPTVQKPSTRKMWTHPRLSTNRAKNTSKRSLARCSTTHAASTTPCCRHQDPSPHNRRIQCKTQKNWSINFLTTPPHIPMPSSHIKQATWYSLATAMHPTYRTPMHEARQEGFSSCPTTTQFLATTEPSS